MAGTILPIPNTNGNLGYPSYGGMQPVPQPSGGFIQNPDPRLQSPTVFYQPPMGMMPISTSASDGYLFLNAQGRAPTFFDGFKVGNPTVYSPIATAALNGIDGTIEQMNMFNAFNQGVPGAIDPSYLWLDDNLMNAPAPPTTAGPAGMVIPQGQQPVLGMPVPRQFNQTFGR